MTTEVSEKKETGKPSGCSWLLYTELVFRAASVLLSWNPPWVASVPFSLPFPLSSGFQPRRKKHSEQRAASVPPLWRHPGMPWFSHLIFLPASSALATQLKRHGPNPASTSVSMNLQHRNRVGMIGGQQGHDSQTVPAAEVRLLPAVVGRVPQRWPSAGQGTRRPTTRA